MKRIVAIALLMLAVGVGTPQVFAEGATETSGFAQNLTGPSETPGRTGTAQSTDEEGPSETPGFFEDVLIYLASTLIM
ncbi:MAG TPA: hypothetical protein VF658_00990 [Pyrinomonadaceae bacterium]|jgi:hypothetical protein